MKSTSPHTSRSDGREEGGKRVRTGEVWGDGWMVR